MATPLGSLFSTIDSIKRVLADRMASPIADLERTLGRAKEDATAFRSTQQKGGAAATDAMLNTVLNIAPAGVIAPALGAEKILGIESVVNRALDMFKSGKTPWAIGTESEKALRQMRNPGDALSVFIGPEGIPRIKIDTKNARLASDAPIKTSRSYDDDITKLTAKALAPRDSMVGEALPLTDYLLHPSLFNISPAASAMKVQHNQFNDLFGTAGGYDKTLNTIQIPSRIYGSGKTRNDSPGELLETLLHEATHGLQIESGVRTGGAPTINSLKDAITAARTQGSFRTPEQLDKLNTYISNVDAMPESELKSARLRQLYNSIYGEWEARQGSQYGRSLPMMNEKGATF